MTISRCLAAGLVCAFANLPLSARAAQVVVTITGTVSWGTDVTGVFGDANRDLKGQPAVLTFTFDPDLGVQGTQACYDGAPCVSWDCSNLVCGGGAAPGVTPPGTAVLRIGRGKFRFGTLPTSSHSSMIRRWVPPAYSEIFLQVEEDYQVTYNDGSYDGGNAYLQASVYPASPQQPLSIDYRWWMPMSDSNLSNYPIQFAIGRSHSGINHPLLQTNGTIVPTSIVVTQKESTGTGGRTE